MKPTSDVKLRARVICGDGYPLQGSDQKFPMCPTFIGKSLLKVGKNVDLFPRIFSRLNSTELGWVFLGGNCTMIKLTMG